MSEKTRSASAATARRARLGTVLVPTDFSSPSLEALNFAAGLLESFEGSLHLIHVQEPDYAYTD